MTIRWFVCLVGFGLFVGVLFVLWDFVCVCFDFCSCFFIWLLLFFGGWCSEKQDTV